MALYLAQAASALNPHNWHQFRQGNRSNSAITQFPGIAIPFGECIFGKGGGGIIHANVTWFWSSISCNLIQCDSTASEGLTPYAIHQAKPPTLVPAAQKSKTHNAKQMIWWCPCQDFTRLRYPRCQVPTWNLQGETVHWPLEALRSSNSWAYHAAFNLVSLSPFKHATLRYVEHTCFSRTSVQVWPQELAMK